MKLIKKIYKFFDKRIIVPITKIFVNLGNKIKSSGKSIEMLTKSKTSIIIMSLIISVFVFYQVDKKSTTLLETNAKVLYNQPVVATYNDEEYVVEGIPETVDITMIGSRANLYLAKQLSNQVITVDLSDLKVGTHQVSLKYKQSIPNVEYKLDPSSVRVTIKNKQSLSKNISEEVINVDELNTKYSISDIKLVDSSYEETQGDDKKEVEDNEVSKVVVKGSEEQIKNVSIVKALIDVSNIGQNIKTGNNNIKDVPLVAYNSKGEIMDVELVPSKVMAKVNLESTSKEVPVEIVPKGIEDIVFGKSIESITSSISKVTIYGTSENLDTINKISVPINVKNIKDNKNYTKTIKLPKGVRDISNKTVTIKIKLGDEASTEVSGVKLSYRNLSSDCSVQVSQESSTEIPVILKGVDSVIKEITATDIEAYIDLKGLEPGEHTVDVNVTGSDNKVIYIPKITSIKVLINKK